MYKKARRELDSSPRPPILKKAMAMAGRGEWNDEAKDMYVEIRVKEMKAQIAKRIKKAGAVSLSKEERKKILEAKAKQKAKDKANALTKDEKKKMGGRLDSGVDQPDNRDLVGKNIYTQIVPGGGCSGK